MQRFELQYLNYNKLKLACLNYNKFDQIVFLILVKCDEVVNHC